jgi:hypothetical protein
MILGGGEVSGEHAVAHHRLDYWLDVGRRHHGQSENARHVSDHRECDAGEVGLRCISRIHPANPD